MSEKYIELLELLLNNEYNKCIELCDEYISGNNFDKFKMIFLKAKCMYNQGKIEEAINLYIKCKNQGVFENEVILRLSECHLRQDNILKAKECFDSCTAKDSALYGLVQLKLNNELAAYESSTKAMKTEAITTDRIDSDVKYKMIKQNDDLVEFEIDTLNKYDNKITRVRLEEKKMDILLEFDRGNEHVIFKAEFSGGVNVSKSNFSQDDKGLFSFKVRKLQKGPWPQLFDSVCNTERFINQNKNKKDWNQISKQLDDDLKGDDDYDEKGDGQEGLMKMFREIYERGNDETKRAMIKSFQTSGGTSLSTNWGEVENKDFEKEISAPNGQEVKKWNE